MVRTFQIGNFFPKRFSEYHDCYCQHYSIMRFQLIVKSVLQQTASHLAQPIWHCLLRKSYLPAELMQIAT